MSTECLFEYSKLPPGKYRITVINVQRNLGTGVSAMSTTVMSVAKDDRKKGLFESAPAKVLPDIVINLKPGSVNYIGSFRAYLDNCEGPTVFCSGYRVEIREALTRDASLLGVAGREDRVILSPIKVDRRSSPHFYSVD